MSEPTISLRDVKDPGRLHPDDWIWITPAERDALVEAVEAARWYRNADEAKLRSRDNAEAIRLTMVMEEAGMLVDERLARFSFDTEEGT